MKKKYVEVFNMGKKEFINGLYPKTESRDNRIAEVQQELEILSLNREHLNKTINFLVYELQILEDMDKLERAIDGKAELQKAKTSNEEEN